MHKRTSTNKDNGFGGKTLTFMKTKLQNRLCEHLDLVVRMFTQPFYTVDTFPYDDAIMAWTDEKERRGLLV